MTSPDEVVKCSYRAGRLTNVKVDATKAAAPGNLAIGIGGRWGWASNPAEGITTALGPAAEE